MVSGIKRCLLDNIVDLDPAGSKLFAYYDPDPYLIFVSGFESGSGSKSYFLIENYLTFIYLFQDK